jgi:hypothetical protein
MGIATGDLEVDAELVEEPLQLGDVLDLKRPAAPPDRERCGKVFPPDAKTSG